MTTAFYMSERAESNATLKVCLESWHHFLNHEIAFPDLSWLCTHYFVPESCIAQPNIKQSHPRPGTSSVVFEAEMTFVSPTNAVILMRSQTTTHIVLDTNLIIFLNEH